MSAQEYKKAGLSFEAPCVDTLDCACRAHDRDCANSLGCSAKADRQLAKSATFNAVVNPDQRELSLGIAAAMTLASITRER
tara:strand:+ start:1174 stop:1416 length:243 start_codon:yes stop_codon:yes gene_type:complete